MPRKISFSLSFTASLRASARMVLSSRSTSRWPNFICRISHHASPWSRSVGSERTTSLFRFHHWGVVHAYLSFGCSVQTWDANASSRCDSKSRAISSGDFPLGEPRGLNTQAHSEQPSNPDSAIHTKRRMTARFYRTASHPQRLSGNLLVDLSGPSRYRIAPLTSGNDKERPQTCVFC